MSNRKPNPAVLDSGELFEGMLNIHVARKSLERLGMIGDLGVGPTLFTFGGLKSW